GVLNRRPEPLQWRVERIRKDTMRKRIDRNGLKTTRRALPLIAAALCLEPSPDASARPVPEVQRVVLKGGQQITGDVLAEKPDALFIDVGYDVIRVPIDQIVRRGSPETTAAPASAVDPESATPSDRFFEARRLDPRPV